MLAGTERCARFTIGDDAHLTHALGYTQLFVEYGAVGRDIHATDVVRRMRHVGNLYPRLILSVFVLQACAIAGHHLVDFDAFLNLSVHRHR